MKQAHTKQNSQHTENRRYLLDMIKGMYAQFIALIICNAESLTMLSLIEATRQGCVLSLFLSPLIVDSTVRKNKQDKTKD